MKRRILGEAILESAAIEVVESKLRANGFSFATTYVSDYDFPEENSAQTLMIWKDVECEDEDETIESFCETLESFLREEDFLFQAGVAPSTFVPTPGNPWPDDDWINRTHQAILQVL